MTDQQDKAARLHELIETPKAQAQLLKLGGNTDMERAWVAATAASLVSFFAKGGKEGNLRGCTAESILQAFYNCVKLRLDPTLPTGELYLIPYGSSAEVCIGYRGLAKLAKRCGAVKDLRTALVYEGDTFEMNAATGEVKHMIDPTVDRSDMKLVLGGYAMAKAPNSDEWITEFMSESQLKERRAAAKTKKVWDAWGDRMRRKTVLRALLMSGQLELTEDLAKAIHDDDEWNSSLGGEERKAPTTPEDLLKDIEAKDRRRITAEESRMLGGEAEREITEAKQKAEDMDAQIDLGDVDATIEAALETAKGGKPPAIEKAEQMFGGEAKQVDVDYLNRIKGAQSLNELTPIMLEISKDGTLDERRKDVLRATCRETIKELKKGLTK